MTSVSSRARGSRIAVTAVVVALLVSALAVVRNRRIDVAERALGIGRHRASAVG